MSLAIIQKELKAPKGQVNSFGNYKYRSCEDIVEAVKPLLADFKYSLILTDEIVAVLDRVYVKATAAIADESGKLIHLAIGYAREGAEKKGMDPAQLTGATSSYARKYALNGLFAIDDTKDADTDAYNKPPMSAHRRNKFIKAISHAIDTADTLAAQEVADELKSEDGWKSYVVNQYIESEHKGEERMQIFYSLLNGNVQITK